MTISEEGEGEEGKWMGKEDDENDIESREVGGRMWKENKEDERHRKEMEKRDQLVSP